MPAADRRYGARPPQRKGLCKMEQRSIVKVVQKKCAASALYIREGADPGTQEELARAGESLLTLANRKTMAALQINAKRHAVKFVVDRTLASSEHFSKKVEQTKKT